MKQTLNIFIPIDFKSRSINAVKRSLELASLFNINLLFCHVYNRPYFILDPEMGYDEDILIQIENYSSNHIEEQIEERFIELKKEIPELDKIHHIFIKEVGNVVDVILNSVKKHEIDLIVMGTTGLFGLKELWGNKTSNIVDQASCPVLVIHEEVQKLNLDKIAVACDFNKIKNLSCLNILKEIAVTALSEIELVHVTKKPESVTSEFNKKAIQLNWVIKNRKKPVQYCYHTNIEEGLMQYVDSNNIGVLALMPHEHSFLDNLLKENITHKMTYHSKIPLLALH